jgi:lysyl-tRNA synthetase class 2
MKRLLAAGSGPIFQLCKVFRNGEVSAAHNPEFTLLEFYRPGVDYGAIMADLEQALGHAELAVRGQGGSFATLPYERLTVRAAVLRETGIDLAAHPTAVSLRVAAEKAGVRVGAGTRYDDVFFHLFLQAVEPKLGRGRPTFLTEYPASMAALARLKPGDASVAERVELYVEGAELANGFSELTDAQEQRRRLLEEAELRRAEGRPVPPVDERFLEALPRMPEAAGIAVGIDRVLMLMVGAGEIAEVLPFPAKDFV